MDLIDLFAIALIYGKKSGRRTELGKGAVGRVRESTISNSNVKDLMMVIAVEETGNMDVLSDPNEYFRICEEYAKTGIDLLHDDVFDKGNEILEDMQDEMLRFYDNFIEE